MNRMVAVQSILDTLKDATYLEIGVNEGKSFRPIRARQKWGVDPSYKIPWHRLLKLAVSSGLGITAYRLFRMTSDAFFETQKEMIAASGIDACFVDGLHTYEQSLRDVLNALQYLNPNGVILVHDCNPTTKLMALPAANFEAMKHANTADWDGAWCGDVWKAIVHLRSVRDDLNVFVLDCDFGIGVISRGRATNRLSYSEADIRAMDYDALASRRKELLDLRSPEFLGEFLRERGAQA